MSFKRVSDGFVSPCSESAFNFIPLGKSTPHHKNQKISPPPSPILDLSRSSIRSELPQYHYKPEEFWKRYDVVEHLKDNQELKIIDREDLSKEFIKSLLGLDTHKVFIHGLVGSGKKSLVYLFAQKVARQEVPRRLKNIRIIDVNRILEEFLGHGLSLMDFESNVHFLYFISDFERFHELTEEPTGLADYLSSCVRNKDSLAVVVDRYLGSDLQKFFPTGFHSLFVSDPNKTHLLQIMQCNAHRYADYHECKFSTALLEKIAVSMLQSSIEYTSISLVQKSFMVMDRIGSLFELHEYENPEADFQSFALDNVLTAIAELKFKKTDLSVSYIS